MRVPPYALALPVWALSPACLAAPCPEDWLAIGFRSPEQTFKTFQTGLRADLPDLEYRCLSGRLKSREQGEGISQLGYREFRAQLFREQPWLKQAARAEVVEVRRLADDRCRLVAHVSFLWHDETFAIDLVREDYYEIWKDDQRAADDAVPWEELARVGEGELLLALPLPPGLAPGEIGEGRAGREWKIDGFPLIGGEAP
jgi:hypothetical protein